MSDKKDKNLITRPPVVVVLGHVDHGKSSLLEAIKDLKITSKESGGITQHIGAYEIEHQGKKITFIDTPGHEAFSAMRSRGAGVADIAVLVIAGEEGVRPQTKEAISHIKKTKIPMIVAINKMDKSEANPEKVKRELVKEDVLVESMGGKIPSIEVSAKTKKGISELLEMILLVAEMEDLKADISKPAEGTIIESRLDSNRGPTATLILQNGVLKRGDILGTNSTAGRIKILEDFLGKKIENGLPAIPLIVLGLEEVPVVGEECKSFSNAEEAKKGIKMKKKELTPEVFDIGPNQKVLNLILKADVFGSLEAVEEVLKNLPYISDKDKEEKVLLRILKAEVGEINETDVKLAKSAKAKIIGFRIKTNKIAKNLALREKITIVNFDVIYGLVQAVRTLLEKLAGPKILRVDLGKIKILEIFKTDKNRQIIGGKVVGGNIKRGAFVDVLRAEKKIGSGKIVGLQKNKKNIDEVAKGQECGVLYEGDVKIEEKDILAAYIEEKKKAEL